MHASPRSNHNADSSPPTTDDDTYSKLTRRDILALSWITGYASSAFIPTPDQDEEFILREDGGEILRDRFWHELADEEGINDDNE